ncbi:VOC family protein [Pigmentibacter sp. JX0631]|uniref:VOC family protein n=1 Tax=Pigmentibacter sp. JX0631 TaxID=2976982 RepID=UPI0024693E8F|nr:VOC family protein [Pigmentibacter sp. JX0631]WGL60414.1 VOC family protein [Pigmentibacter sp. JX0631]
MNPWIENIGHLAIVIDDLEKGKWFFGEVLQTPYFMFRDTQIMIPFSTSILVAKLEKDAVDKSRQAGALEKQVLDHYGFQAQSAEKVDLFYEHLKKFSIEIIRAPYDRSDGRAFYFRDPFGNLVEYFWYNRN